MAYHIFKINKPDVGLTGAQILNEITADKSVFRVGDNYIYQEKVYDIIVVTALNHSGLFAHMYVFEYNQQMTEDFIKIGII